MPLQIDVITLFPNLMKPYFKESILKIALLKKKIKINFHNPRDFATNKHKKVDDTPFGGGPGMVLMPQPFFDCIRSIKKTNKGPVIFLSPKGKVLNQAKAVKLSKLKSVILICGRYEGLDQRVIDELVDEEISIGKFILSGGELPALILIEAITRLQPGVLHNEESTKEESFGVALKGKKKHPVYTQPANFEGHEIPEVLKSGHHKKIQEWRNQNLGT